MCNPIMNCVIQQRSSCIILLLQSIIEGPFGEEINLQGGDRVDRTASASCSGRYSTTEYSGRGHGRPDAQSPVYDAVYVPLGVTLPRSRSGVGGETPSPVKYAADFWQTGPKDHLR